MSTESYQAVILDMDGVLCNSEPFICEAACQMFAESHNVRVKPEDFAPFVGTGEDRYLGGVAEKHGVKLHATRDKKRTYEIYLRLIQGRLMPLAGVSEFLDECRRRKIKVGLATSADRVKMEGNLAQIALPPKRFDVCVTGSDVQRKKPDPQIFQLAAVRMGVEAGKCLVVEDAPNGIAAGKAAGARCLGLTTSFPEAVLRQAGADWIARDFTSLPAEVWSPA